MKWFKHMCSINKESKLCNDLSLHFGCEGYTFYMKLHELIGHHIEKESKSTKLSKSFKELAINCMVSPQKLHKIIKFCSTSSEVSIKFINKNIVEIEIPNMLNLLDEYTSKSGQTSRQQSRQVSGETPTQESESESESESEKTKNKIKKFTDESAEVDQIYFIYPKKKNPKEAKKAIAKVLNNGITLPELKDYVLRYRNSALVRTTDAQYIPYPATWFNKHCWKEIDDDPKAWDAKVNESQSVKREMFSEQNKQYQDYKEGDLY